MVAGSEFAGWFCSQEDKGDVDEICRVAGLGLLEGPGFGCDSDADGDPGRGKPMTSRSRSRLRGLVDMMLYNKWVRNPCGGASSSR